MNLDASPDHRLDPATKRWLRNTPTLYGEESAALRSGVATAQTDIA